MDSLEHLQIYLDELSENKIFIGLIMVLVNIGARFIIEELGEEFPTSTCVIHENFNSSDIEVKYSDLMNMNFKGHHDPDKLSNAIFEILNY